MVNDYIRFPCLPVEQPIGIFYIGVIDAADLAAISYADVRRPEGRDIERYIGTQRDLAEGRVAEIKQYVKSVDASFPTSIILYISSEHATYDEAKGILSIKNDEKVAKIIDGQHRIAGLKDYSGPRFQMNVTIFIDMDIEDQAMVFATINLKQTKVAKSLAYDLYEYAQSRSPQKTCHNIAKLLNSKVGSPFYQRIKILGKATGVGTEVITQATFVDRLLRLMSSDPMKDRDLLKRGKPIEKIEGKRGTTFIFRERFEAKDRDAEIAKILWNYFKAVEKTWQRAWNNFDRGFILTRTTGFAALLRILPLIWVEMQFPAGVPSIEDFYRFLAKSDLGDADFTSVNFKPGSGGESALFDRLNNDIFR